MLLYLRTANLSSPILLFRNSTDVDPIGKGGVQQGGEPDGVITQIIPGSSVSQPWPKHLSKGQSAVV